MSAAGAAWWPLAWRLLVQQGWVLSGIGAAKCCWSGCLPAETAIILCTAGDVETPEKPAALPSPQADAPSQQKPLAQQQQPATADLKADPVELSGEEPAALPATAAAEGPVAEGPAEAQAAPETAAEAAAGSTSLAVPASAAGSQPPGDVAPAGAAAPAQADGDMDMTTPQAVAAQAERSPPPEDSGDDDGEYSTLGSEEDDEATLEEEEVLCLCPCCSGTASLQAAALKPKSQVEQVCLKRCTPSFREPAASHCWEATCLLP